MHNLFSKGIALLLALTLFCACSDQITKTHTESVIIEQTASAAPFENEPNLPATSAPTKTTVLNTTIIEKPETTPTIIETSTTIQENKTVNMPEETTVVSEKTIAAATETVPEIPTKNEAEATMPEITEEPVDDRFAPLGIPEDVGYSYYTEEMREQMLENNLDYQTVESLIDVGFIFSEMLEMSHEERKVRSFAHMLTYFDGSTEELLAQLPETEAYIMENYADIVSKKQYGSSVQGRSLDAYFLSNTDTPRQKIILTFAMHGYEGDSENDGAYLTESAYAMMLFYAQNPEFLGEAQLIFCPMLNPDGVYAPKDAKYGREQSEGIDMNRDFKKGRFNAAESIALKAFLQETEPDILIDFHGWLNATYGDSALAKVFNKYARLYHWDKQYGASQGYLIGYAHNQGIRSLLVEHEHFTEINSAKVIYALNEICRQAK